MAIADIIRLVGTPLTSQQLADLAKASYDEWRRALAMGDAPRAATHFAEFEALCDLFQKS